jgi:crotonobetainyl-CoA:carnitine CoA-transferase CaiB-like acyl-CoA transferase
MKGGATGPLRGVRVLDATTMLAGPYLGALLADFGADVVKVEDVGDGDPMRHAEPVVEGQHLPSKTTNRNKRSVALDLRTEYGRELFRRMSSKVDIVCVNFRPATLRRWKLDYADLVADNPRLVMFHLTAFGRSGPYADRPGFARVAEAFAGLTHITGDPGGPPMFAGFPIADGLAGAHGAFAVMLALYERERSGRGQLVEMALYDPVLRMLDGLVTAYDVTGDAPNRNGNDNRDIAPNGLYQTADEAWIVLPISSPNMWQRFCQAIGRSDLANDQRFATNVDRVARREELDAILRPTLVQWPAGELLERLHGHGVAAGPVNTMADVCADSHLWQTGSLVRVADHHLKRDVAMPAVVPRLSASPGAVNTVGPEPGENTREVLHELADVDDVEFAALLKSGSIMDAPAMPAAVPAHADD